MSLFFVYEGYGQTTLEQLPDTVSGVCMTAYSLSVCLQLVKLILGSAGFMLVSCLADSSALKMEVTCSSRTLVDFHLTALNSS
jgi:hypothetical protein